MFKVSRKSEYALIAVQHMSRHPYGEVVSVAELAAAETIPPNILAKVLQGLKRAGVLMATKGAGGGYRLARPVDEIRFLEVVRPFEEQIAVVTCQGADATATSCERTGGCGLRDPMAVLNTYLLRQFENLTMDTFLQPHQILHSAPRPPSGLPLTKAARVSGVHAVRAGTGPA
jgi:Rrf2 family protein